MNGASDGHSVSFNFIFFLWSPIVALEEFQPYISLDSVWEGKPPLKLGLHFFCVCDFPRIESRDVE